MKSEVLSLSEFAFLGELAVVIFVSVFLFSIFWMLRPGAKKFYQHVALMPLEDAASVSTTAYSLEGGSDD